MKEHYHCKECGIILNNKPAIQNKLSYLCDNCLIAEQISMEEEQ